MTNKTHGFQLTRARDTWGDRVRWKSQNEKMLKRIITLVINAMRILFKRIGNLEPPHEKPV